jgi:tol-pal system protein YbgF
MQYLKLALLGLACTLAFGCTAAKQQSATATASTEWRMQSLEESFLNFREEQRSQADKSAQQAEAIEKRLAALEEAVEALKSDRVESATPDDMAGKAEDKEWVTDLSPDEEAWVEGNKPPEKSVAQSGEVKPWAEVPGPPPVAPDSIPDPKVIKRDKPAPRKKVASVRKPSGAQAMYDAAYTKYNAGDFEGARGAFDEFLKKYPKSSLVPNALYWKGETYYSQKDYPQAILAFKEVTGRFSKHAKAAAALLKIGMSYDRVGDPDNAIFYLRALVEDFPGSGPAAIGRKELTRLGG